MYLDLESVVRRTPRLIASALFGAAAAWAAGFRNAPSSAEKDATEAKIEAAIDVEPSGDADTDFVAAMVPHHQGAIDMAQTELRYGRNEQLRRLAQEIIVTQQQEIAAMRLAIGQPLPPSVRPPAPPSPTVSSGTRPAAQRVMHRPRGP